MLSSPATHMDEVLLRPPAILDPVSPHAVCRAHRIRVATYVLLLPLLLRCTAADSLPYTYDTIRYVLLTYVQRYGSAPTSSPSTTTGPARLAARLAPGDLLIIVDVDDVCYISVVLCVSSSCVWYVGAVTLVAAESA